MSGGAFDFNTAERAPQPFTPQETERRLDTLRHALKSRASELVRELFPAARIIGHEARIGDATGAAGESMCIELSGEKAGQWNDHNAGAAETSGDLITLWCMGQGYGAGPGFWRAVDDLEQHLGMSAKPRGLGAVARVAAERARAPKVAEPTKVSEQTHVYTSADGRTVLAQVIRREMSDGSKRFLQRNAAGEWKSPEVRPLYNLPGIVGAACVVLVEGEKCADALKAMGVPATTLMGGSGTILDKADLEPLRGKQVLTWADNDDAGKGFMQLVGVRLRGMGCNVCPVAIPDGVKPKWDVADAAGEGRDVLAMLDAARALPAVSPGLVLVPAADRSMKLLTLRQLRAVKPPRWLIKGILPEASYSCIVGPFASYKSFLALDFGLHVANGRDWLGHPVKQGPVLYVAGEGQAGVAPRTIAWTETKGGDEDAPFLTLPQGVAMPTGELDELLALIATMDAPPVLIILDTLARCFGQGDENSSTDMGAFVKACDRLKRETGACVLVIHHTGKDVEKGMRGSSALPAALDCTIAVERMGDGLTIYNRPPYGKMKDAAEFDDIAMTAARVVIGTDEDGEDLSTLVLIEAAPLIVGEGESGPPKGGKGRPPKAQEAVLAALQEADTRGMPGLGMSGLKGRPGIEPKSLAAVLRALVGAGLVKVEEAGAAPIWSVV
jgi:hypothetical protein